MKAVRVEEAVGMVLGHDLTKIVPGQYKGRAFKRGHIISSDDLPEMLNIGKEHVFIMEVNAGELHEDEAAVRLASALCGSNLSFVEPSEGKVNIYAAVDGLFKVKKETVYAVNYLGEVSVATIHGNTPVRKGEKVAGARVIPLVIDKAKIIAAENIAAAAAPSLQVVPYMHHRVGIITTGNEVFHRRIEDRFGPVVLQKLGGFPSCIMKHVIVQDDKEAICRNILDLYRLGAQMIFITGGMSVDPDDRTPAAIRSTGAEIITYGTPVLPGSMLMLAYLGDVPVIGLPGCVMFNKITVFDLILPRLFTAEKLARHHFTEMAVGGLCNNCDPCRYPHCSFGKN